MTSVELLERAAKVLRHRAQAATPGPWDHVDYHGSDPNTDSTYMGSGSVITWGEGVEGCPIAAPNGDLYPRSGYSPIDDMALVATMHPPVALALADALEHGSKCERHYLAEFGYRVVPNPLLAVARAILREPEPEVVAA